MANYTPNYHLYLPNRNDPEQVDTTLSANFETIDTEIKNRANEIEEHKNATAAHSSDHITHGDGTVQDTLFDLNKDISDTSERLELIIGDNGNSNAEIVDARGGFPLLRDRLTDSDGKIINLQNLTRFEALGLLSLIVKGSLYIKNDYNIFGYLSDGVTYSNLATMEQNDIAKLGDDKARTWIMGKPYVRVMAPSFGLFEAWDSSYNPTTPLRDIYHSGNLTNHALIHQANNQVLTKLASNKMTLGSPVTNFPSGSVTGGNTYTIPRKGIYLINMTIKVTTAVTLANGYVRFGISHDVGGTVTDRDFDDESYSNVYNLPFLSTTFMYNFNAGDKVTPFVKPLNEDITIGAGSKFYIYYLGDNPTI
ncbi:hypothetical protein [Heyndrickxia camelliae]|uniref:Uncharacterized protein n=1 Tax=Heyndrickxia camelliae TaxID=1707093 RepID=A0A2N3LNI2_9BACI|nr:hypothetical protein [Heyndrickxia camelliae]PKR86099.1 hypothetical protein CWO92_06930 [Heyndrickxia camelliae]